MDSTIFFSPTILSIPRYQHPRFQRLLGFYWIMFLLPVTVDYKNAFCFHFAQKVLETCALFWTFLNMFSNSPDVPELVVSSQLCWTTLIRFDNENNVDYLVDNDYYVSVSECHWQQHTRADGWLSQQVRVMYESQIINWTHCLFIHEMYTCDGNTFMLHIKLLMICNRIGYGCSKLFSA